MEKLKWTTQKRKVDDLIPYELNPRKITDAQRKILEDSLEKFGLVEIPAINVDNTIIAGHQRMQVLKLTGHGQDEIEVRVPNRELTKEEFDAYLLTSNRNAGEWDWERLISFDKGMLAKTGFDSKEIDKIFSKADMKDDKFDAGEEYAKIKEPESVRGEVYQLGHHRVMCGDATNRADVEKLMGGGKASMVFTDPPYNINYQGPMNTHDQTRREGIENDNMSEEQFADFIGKSFRNMLEFTEGAFYICMSSKELWSIKKEFENAGGHWQSFIIWVKNTFTLGRSDWQNKYEPILYGWNNNLINHYYAGWRNEANVWDDIDTLKPSFENNKTTIKVGDLHLELDGSVTGKVINKTGQVDIWQENKPNKNPDHPTMKPIKLMARAIQASSTRGQIVLDLFGGSGSTLIAAHKLDRTCYTMEYDPKYVDVIRKRYEKLEAENS